MVGRTLVMGDVHGNLQAFKQCMLRCSFDRSRDLLIQLGDVADRHLYTAEVVEELLSIPSLIAIRGNHDKWVRDWLINGTSHSRWLENGGRETITSYQRNIDKIDLKRHTTFFTETQLDYYIDREKRLFVHAGYTHPEGPQYEQDPSVCYLDRSLWKMTQEGLNHKHKPLLLENFKEIFIGHTPTLNWFQDQPMTAFNVWNLDTGAGTTGKLTVMDAMTKEYWQSD